MRELVHAEEMLDAVAEALSVDALQLCMAFAASDGLYDVVRLVRVEGATNMLVQFERICLGGDQIRIHDVPSSVAVVRFLTKKGESAA